MEVGMSEKVEKSLGRDAEAAMNSIADVVRNHAEDPTQVMWRLHLIREMLNNNIAEAEKEALPLLLAAKEKRGITRPDFEVNMHGVIFEALMNNTSFNSASYKPLSQAIGNMNKISLALRRATLYGADNGYPKMKVVKLEYKMKCYFTGNKKGIQIADKEV